MDHNDEFYLLCAGVPVKKVVSILLSCLNNSQVNSNKIPASSTILEFRIERKVPIKSNMKDNGIA